MKSDDALQAANTQVARARLIAAASPQAGDHLNALSCSAVGTRLDDTRLGIAVALCLDIDVRARHLCICGHPVGSSSTHSLVCRKLAGLHTRHNSVNDLVKRALASAGVPSVLEHSSVSRDDGKRPDSLSLPPWTNGCCLIWDSACPDTLAASHLDRAVLAASAVANNAEQRKRAAYFSLAARFISCQLLQRR